MHIHKYVYTYIYIHIYKIHIIHFLHPIIPLSCPPNFIDRFFTGFILLFRRYLILYYPNDTSV